MRGWREAALELEAEWRARNWTPGLTQAVKELREAVREQMELRRERDDAAADQA
jgi:hypothetical protein